MINLKSFQNSLSKISESSFDNHAIELFRYQARYNSIYKEYLNSLNINPVYINEVSQIPFLPIEFFKSHTIKTNEWKSQIVFESSGTTQKISSKHHIQDVEFYHLHAKHLFENIFGTLAGKTILALLPSYLERQGSSLVSMVDSFIQTSQSVKSGFYLYNMEELVQLLNNSQHDDVYLFGVSFALLDLATQYNLKLGHVTIIETGGMKGRREEIIKEELYDLLRQKLGVKKIYSEYGMTELLSQAYGKNGKFSKPNSMKVLIRDINDPYAILARAKTGGINIIDLANAHSCAFIETKDLGRINADGTFEVLGRFDNSDLRGCNLLVS
jgi:hypothetical protein